MAAAIMLVEGGLLWLVFYGTELIQDWVLAALLAVQVVAIAVGLWAADTLFRRIPLVVAPEAHEAR